MLNLDLIYLMEPNGTSNLVMFSDKNKPRTTTDGQRIHGPVLHQESFRVNCSCVQHDANHLTRRRQFNPTGQWLWARA